MFWSKKKFCRLRKIRPNRRNLGPTDKILSKIAKLSKKTGIFETAAKKKVGIFSLFFGRLETFGPTDKTLAKIDQFSKKMEIFETASQKKVVEFFFVFFRRLENFVCMYVCIKNAEAHPSETPCPSDQRCMTTPLNLWAPPKDFSIAYKMHYAKKVGPPPGGLCQKFWSPEGGVP